MANLELRHLRTICAIAEEGSVSKAAARIGVSQPAMTTQLRSIERLIGGDLFERSPTGSVPTELGRSLIRSARVVLDDVKTLLNMGDPKARSAADTSLVFASMPMLFTGTVVSELAAWIRCAEVRVQTYTAGSGVLDLVASGRADVAVFEWFEGVDQRKLSGVEVRSLVREPQFVGLSEDDPLAGADEIDLADLARRDWVVPPPEEDGLRIQLRHACDAAGFLPRLTHQVSDARTAMTLTADGAVCLLQPASIDGYGVVVRPLRGTPLITPVLLAIRSDGPWADRRHELTACVAHAYSTIVARNPYYAKWWIDHPEHHAELDAALLLPRPSRPQ
ncbi:DNA-binding transcriptional regulator, LysR family [Actinokineospora alba]|uniref:DNA-binding transcriptional regulator, LysR family n=1 Tax=Actinokineospora alba TaxID=504798 RepID=A0A1H0PL35_9PSEU|nr:LysR family transcriptional regulator [Actinokineospora alba]TDP65833.1 DNA-binding transcriptional LysR family regulator [Actinokineospora alba]SDI64105.1 DNA-binding transcriptional regulator, LysR family [Actinokineospora alba]SDP05375.1 DNA-binding transcriptional regulator, LysR family [Actinokineospora alba]